MILRIINSMGILILSSIRPSVPNNRVGWSHKATRRHFRAIMEMRFRDWLDSTYAAMWQISRFILYGTNHTTYELYQYLILDYSSNN